VDGDGGCMWTLHGLQVVFSLRYIHGRVITFVEWNDNSVQFLTEEPSIRLNVCTIERKQIPNIVINEH